MSTRSHPFGAPAGAWRPSPHTFTLWSRDASGWEEEVVCEMAWKQRTIQQSFNMTAEIESMGVCMSKRTHPLGAPAGAWRLSGNTLESESWWQVSEEGN